MERDEAYAFVARALDEGRAAHGYLVVGDTRGDALEFVYLMLEKLFGPERVRMRAHPDIHWLLPELKTRKISVDAMRTRLVEPMALTAFAGGWKAGVVLGADRLQKESANAFLKTLEEPTPRTIFFLLTDAPEQLLPTIVSRCQRLDVGRVRGLRETWRLQVLKILSAEHGAGAVAQAAAAARLVDVLAELKAAAEAEVKAEETASSEEDAVGEETSKEQLDACISARYYEYRTECVRVILGWFRDLAAVCCAGADAPLVNAPYRQLLARRAAKITRAQAFANVAAVETLAVSLARNMNEQAVFFALTDRLVFGTEGT